MLGYPYSKPADSSVYDIPGDWFALRVNATAEQRTVTALEGKGFEAYLPQYCEYRNWGHRLRKVQRALFPGYVFARFCSTLRLPILTIPTVSYILGTSAGPTPVDPDEFAAVRRIAECGAMAEPFPFLSHGDFVSIEGGPLRGLTGRLVSLGKDLRVVVSISLLQRSIAVTIDRRWVRPASEGNATIAVRRSARFSSVTGGSSNTIKAS